MIILRFIEIVIKILVIMFAGIFAICGIGMILTKDAVNSMMEFKGDEKDEQ